MSISELKVKLFELEIPHYYYSIVDGEEDQRVCLRENGGKWLVYYSEDGERLDLAEHGSEAAACDDLLGRVTE